MSIEAVALFTRAWIEIVPDDAEFPYITVALFTRAWIEIASLIQSLGGDTVALFTRAWIEIYCLSSLVLSLTRRPLHEGVD